MAFGRNRSNSTYRSGRRFASYYTRVCLRCGWAFRPPRHETHRMVDCDDTIATSNDDALAKAMRDRNLYG